MAVVAIVVLSCSNETTSSPPTTAAGASAGPAVTAGAGGGGNGAEGPSAGRPPTGGTGASEGGASGGSASASGGEPQAGAGAGQAGAAGTAPMGGGGAGGTEPVESDDRCSVAIQDPARPPRALDLSGALGAHDPVIIAAGGKFYSFMTGDNLGAKTSTDMLRWQASPDVLTPATRPAWLAQQVPGVSNLWAPDISFFGGTYHLYYSASTFGKNRSCIGHLTRASLDSGSWVDEGPVICSNVSTKDDWNAIDPNVIVDEKGKPWLAFGSFWGGLKLIELDEQGARVGTTVTALAARPSAGGALEAPFIVRRCGYFYLFMSWDKCCAGVDSTYNIRVGRSREVQGPYVDKDGKALLEGGGTLVLQGAGRWRGPGHNAVLFAGQAAFNVYHSYDAERDGAPTLRISELVWDVDGWPVSGGP